MGRLPLVCLEWLESSHAFDFLRPVGPTAAPPAFVVSRRKTGYANSAFQVVFLVAQLHQTAAV